MPRVEPNRAAAHTGAPQRLAFRSNMQRRSPGRSPWRHSFSTDISEPPVHGDRHFVVGMMESSNGEHTKFAYAAHFVENGPERAQIGYSFAKRSLNTVLPVWTVSRCL